MLGGVEEMGQNRAVLGGLGGGVHKWLGLAVTCWAYPHSGGTGTLTSSLQLLTASICSGVLHIRLHAKLHSPSQLQPEIDDLIQQNHEFRPSPKLSKLRMTGEHEGSSWFGLDLVLVFNSNSPFYLVHLA